MWSFFCSSNGKRTQRPKTDRNQVKELEVGGQTGLEVGQGQGLREWIGLEVTRVAQKDDSCLNEKTKPGDLGKS